MPKTGFYLINLLAFEISSLPLHLTKRLLGGLETASSFEGYFKLACFASLPVRFITK